MKRSEGRSTDFDGRRSAATVSHIPLLREMTACSRAQRSALPAAKAACHVRCDLNIGTERQDRAADRIRGKNPPDPAFSFRLRRSGLREVMRQRLFAGPSKARARSFPNTSGRISYRLSSAN